jgi:hypothetical protein
VCEHFVSDINRWIWCVGNPNQYYLYTCIDVVAYLFLCMKQILCLSFLKVFILYFTSNYITVFKLYTSIYK